MIVVIENLKTIIKIKFTLNAAFTKAFEYFFKEKENFMYFLLIIYTLKFELLGIGLACSFFDIIINTDIKINFL